jgi:hypothetical protein
MMMTVVPKVGAVVMMLLSLMLARCTGSIAPSSAITTTTTATSLRTTGVVTGVAYACSGLPAVITGRQKVRVSLHSGSRPVSSVTIRSGARYRFSVTPGTYRLVGWWRSKTVTVRTGDVATVNIVDYCR